MEVDFAFLTNFTMLQNIDTFLAANTRHHDAVRR